VAEGVWYWKPFPVRQFGDFSHYHRQISTAHPQKKPPAPLASKTQDALGHPRGSESRCGPTAPALGSRGAIAPVFAAAAAAIALVFAIAAATIAPAFVTAAATRADISVEFVLKVVAAPWRRDHSFPDSAAILERLAARARPSERAPRLNYLRANAQAGRRRSPDADIQPYL
jgi:hypothetical protein